MNQIHTIREAIAKFCEENKGVFLSPKQADELAVAIARCLKKPKKKTKIKSAFFIA